MPRERIGERGEVPALTTGVGAQVQAGIAGEAGGGPRVGGVALGTGFVHTATLAASVEFRHGSPGDGD